MPEKEIKISHPERLSGKDLAKVIHRTIDGLIYISETDAPVELLYVQDCDQISPEMVFDKFGNVRPETSVSKISFRDFFEKLERKRDWHGPEETERAAAFGKLRSVLEDNLIDLHVYRTGKVQVDIFVIGKDESGNLAGIKTKAVET